MRPDQIARLKAYLLCMAAGLAIFLSLATFAAWCYWLIEGRTFFVPMKPPGLDFIALLAGPMGLAAFGPFMGLHLIAAALHMRVTPVAAALAGAAVGALAAWSTYGGKTAFLAPAGPLPNIGWYATAMVAVAALIYDLFAEKRGF
jgi:hypothetical protein